MKYPCQVGNEKQVIPVFLLFIKRKHSQTTEAQQGQGLRSAGEQPVGLGLDAAKRCGTLSAAPVVVSTHQFGQKNPRIAQRDLRRLISLRSCYPLQPRCAIRGTSGSIEPRTPKPDGSC